MKEKGGESKGGKKLKRPERDSRYKQQKPGGQRTSYGTRVGKGEIRRGESVRKIKPVTHHEKVSYRCGSGGLEE